MTLEVIEDELSDLTVDVRFIARGHEGSRRIEYLRFIYLARTLLVVLVPYVRKHGLRQFILHELSRNLVGV